MSRRDLIAMLPLLAGCVVLPAAVVAEEPAAAWSEEMWSQPLWPAQPPPAAAPEAADVVDPVPFLLPIRLEGMLDAVAAARTRPQGAAPPAAVPPAAPYVAVTGRGGQAAPAVTFPEGVLGGPPMTLNPDGAARVTIVPELGTTPNFGTSLRGAGVSVQGGSSRLGVGVGVSRDETGRTTGGLGVTLTLP